MFFTWVQLFTTEAVQKGIWISIKLAHASKTKTWSSNSRRKTDTYLLKFTETFEAVNKNISQRKCKLILTEFNLICYFTCLFNDFAFERASWAVFNSDSRAAISFKMTDCFSVKLSNVSTCFSSTFELFLCAICIRFWRLS